MAEIARRTFSRHFKSPVEKVWPIVADTARVNEAAGFPKHDIEEIVQPDGSVTFNALAHLGPFEVAWDDQPQNWVTNRWMEHRRYPKKAPVTYFGARFDFTPEDGGCRIDVALEMEPARWMPRPMVLAAVLPVAERTFAATLEQLDAFIDGEVAQEFSKSGFTPSAGVAAKIDEIVEAVEGTKYGHGLAARLADYITTHQEIECATLRPRHLARLWEVPERLAIEVCLQAAQSGLLGSRWQILCPRCQVGKSEVRALGELPKGAHCPSCNISYERDFTKNVELAFAPSRTIRPIDAGEYCLFGPMSTPHIKVQLTVPANKRVEEAVDLMPGAYRLRTLEPGGETVIDWPGIDQDGGGFPEIVADAGEVMTGSADAPGTVAFDNRMDRPRTFIVEEYAWRRDVLTAHKVTTMQAFRELFDEDVLRPGDMVEIDNVTLMFTDFKGSTALYERIGDSQAYHLIRAFFEVLGGAIRNHDGTIVKTIGDAVNAAFADPADALRCAIQIQDDVETFNAGSGKEPITVTVGLHIGRCISVTLNGQLDYYGTAANKAARLEGESQGGDVVLSTELAGDPVVKPLLGEYAPVAGTAMLKGFDAPVDYVRITAETLAASRPIRSSKARSRNHVTDREEAKT